MMGNNVHEVDLHIEVGTEWYCGDASITCIVTYPAQEDAAPITIDYNTTGTDDLDVAIERAVKDIAAYMRDPDEWIQEYIDHSSEDWRKLHSLEANIAEYQEKIASEERLIATTQRWLAENEAKAAALRAKLTSM